MNKTVCLMACKNLYCERNYKNVMKEKGVEALHADYQDLRNTPLCEGYRDNDEKIIKEK